MNWEDKLAGWQEKARDIGTAAERELGSTALGNETGLVSPYDRINLGANNIADYQTGRTQALYTPRQATNGGYAGFGETPAANQYTSTHELQRLKDIELGTQERLKKYALNVT